MGIPQDFLACLKLWEYFNEHYKNFKYRKYPYYFDNFNRKVYVDSNGNGVIVVMQEIVVLDVEKTDGIKIKIDISDSQDDCEFPLFKNMLKKKLKPFKDFKFSYSAKGNIIDKVIENYDELYPTEGRNWKNNKKAISLKMKFRKNNLKKGGRYVVRYMFSIPKMYTIVDGYFGGTKEPLSPISSVTEFDRNFNNFKGSLYLSSSINRENDVHAYLDNERNNNYLYIEENMLYNKYTVNLKEAYKHSSFAFL